MALTKINYAGQGTVPLAQIPTLNLAKIPTLDHTKMPSRSVVQYQYRHVTMNQGTSTSNSGEAVSEFYVDITPKNTNNLIVFSTSIAYANSTSAGYAKFNVYKTISGSTSQWSSGFNGTAGYVSTAGEWYEVPVITTNTAGTTSAMRLQLYVITPNGGTTSFGWSNGSVRTVAAWEIAA